jgi:hypothetical protein
VRGAAGDPLPVVFKSFQKADIQPRRGQFILMCAGPGTGKSVLTLAYVMKSRLPAVYFSADSDAFDQLTRAISIETGWDLEQSKKAVLEDDHEAITKALGGIPIRFNYDPAPTLDTVENAVASYEEVYGEYPSLIVVDNVTNVDLEGAGEGEAYASGLEDLMEYLHSMARNTGACVFGLHHVTAENNNGDRPIPLNGVKGQITRIPQIVLTIHKKPSDDDNEVILCVSAVKNRSGRNDASGATYAELEFIGETMTIRDPESSVSVQWEDPEEDSSDDVQRMWQEGVYP